MRVLVIQLCLLVFVTSVFWLDSALTFPIDSFERMIVVKKIVVFIDRKHVKQFQSKIVNAYNKLYICFFNLYYSGTSISGYIIRNGTWIEIGRGDPNYPLVLYDVTHKTLEMKNGDIIVSYFFILTHLILLVQ